MVTAKEIFDLLKKGATTEAQAVIVDLQGELVDLKAQNNTLRERIQEL